MDLYFIMITSDCMSCLKMLVDESSIYIRIKTSKRIYLHFIYDALQSKYVLESNETFQG